MGRSCRWIDHLAESRSADLEKVGEERGGLDCLYEEEGGEKNPLSYNQCSMIDSLSVLYSHLMQVCSIKTRKTSDISYTYQAVYIFGLGLFLIYGYSKGLWVVYAPATFELGCIILLTFLKVW